MFFFRREIFVTITSSYYYDLSCLRYILRNMKYLRPQFTFFKWIKKSRLIPVLWINTLFRKTASLYSKRVT